VSFSNESIHTGLYAAPFLFSRITLYIRKIISYPLLKLGAFGFLQLDFTAHGIMESLAEFKLRVQCAPSVAYTILFTVTPNTLPLPHSTVSQLIIHNPIFEKFGIFMRRL